MASLVSHPAVPLALSIALGPEAMPPGLTATACVASVLPDVDSLGFAAGIPYGHPLGHRGFTHSLAFALLIALASMALAKRLGTSPITAFLVIFASAASHGFLDAMTTGGLGVAFFSPISNARYFLPWRVIPVSPIDISRFVSARGLQILKAEFVWIWLPAALLAAAGLAVRKLTRLG